MEAEGLLTCLQHVLLHVCYLLHLRVIKYVLQREY